MSGEDVAQQLPQAHIKPAESEVVVTFDPHGRIAPFEAEWGSLTHDAQDVWNRWPEIWKQAQVDQWEAAAAAYSLLSAAQPARDEKTRVLWNHYFFTIMNHLTSAEPEETEEMEVAFAAAWPTVWHYQAFIALLRLADGWWNVASYIAGETCASYGSSDPTDAAESIATLKAYRERREIPPMSEGFRQRLNAMGDHPPLQETPPTAAAVAQARKDALEQAARLVEAHQEDRATCKRLAAAIRGLAGAVEG